MNSQEYQQLIKTNIITELNLEDLDNEKKIALIDKLAKLTERRVLLRILKGLTEEDIIEYEKIANNEDSKIKYLEQRIPDFINILQDEVVEVKKELLNELLNDENIK